MYAGVSSAYILFSTKIRQTIKEEHPEMTNKDIIRETGVRWKALSEDEKAPYEAMGVADKERCVALYSCAHGLPVSPVRCFPYADVSGMGRFEREMAAYKALKGGRGAEGGEDEHDVDEEAEVAAQSDEDDAGAIDEDDMEQSGDEDN